MKDYQHGNIKNLRKWLNQRSIKIENLKIHWSYFDKCLTTIKSFHLGLVMNLKGFAKVKLHDVKNISYMITYSSHFMWNFNLMQKSNHLKTFFFIQVQNLFNFVLVCQRKLGELFAHGWLAIEYLMLVLWTIWTLCVSTNDKTCMILLHKLKIKGDMYLGCTWTNDFQAIFTNAFFKNMVLPSRWCD